jgi:hypothetical protein
VKSAKRLAIVAPKRCRVSGGYQTVTDRHLGDRPHGLAGFASLAERIFVLTAGGRP